MSVLDILNVAIDAGIHALPARPAKVVWLPLCQRAFDTDLADDLAAARIVPRRSPRVEFAFASFSIFAISFSALAPWVTLMGRGFALPLEDVLVALECS